MASVIKPETVATMQAVVRDNLRPELCGTGSLTSSGESGNTVEHVGCYPDKTMRLGTAKPAFIEHATEKEENDCVRRDYFLAIVSDGALMSNGRRGQDMKRAGFSAPAKFAQRGSDCDGRVR
jgi:hypothetical protein